MGVCSVVAWLRGCVDEGEENKQQGKRATSSGPACQWLESTFRNCPRTRVVTAYLLARPPLASTLLLPGGCRGAAGGGAALPRVGCSVEYGDEDRPLYRPFILRPKPSRLTEDDRRDLVR